MRQMIGVTFSFMLIASVACADVLTTTSDNIFQQGVEKQIRIEMPANCSAFNGTLQLTNCTLVSIAEEFPNKIADSNGNKFIVYDLNSEVMIGDNLIVTVLANNNSAAVVEIVDAMGATPDAQAIVVDDFSLSLTSGLDLNGDGVLDSNDVVFIIQGIYDGNLLVTDLQNIINAVIAEIT